MEVDGLSRDEARKICTLAGVAVDESFSLPQLKAALKKKFLGRDLTSAEAFALMDADCSGALEGDEVVEALRLMDLPLEPDDIAEVMVEMAPDGDGVVTLVEFQNWWRTVMGEEAAPAAAEIASAQAAAGEPAAAAAAGGRVSPSQIEAVAHPEEAKRLCLAAGLNVGDADASLINMKAALFGYYSEARMTARRVSLELDANKSGFLDLAEVGQAVAMLGLILADSDVAELMAEMDPDGDGRVTLDEFRSWWQEAMGEEEDDEEKPAAVESEPVDHLVGKTEAAAESAAAAAAAVAAAVPAEVAAAALEAQRRQEEEDAEVQAAQDAVAQLRAMTQVLAKATVTVEEGEPPLAAPAAMSVAAQRWRALQKSHGGGTLLSRVAAGSYDREQVQNSDGSNAAQPDAQAELDTLRTQVTSLQQQVAVLDRASAGTTLHCDRGHALERITPADDEMQLCARCVVRKGSRAQQRILFHCTTCATAADTAYALCAACHTVEVARVHVQEADAAAVRRLVVRICSWNTDGLPPPPPDQSLAELLYAVPANPSAGKTSAVDDEPADIVLIRPMFAKPHKLSLTLSLCVNPAGDSRHAKYYRRRWLGTGYQWEPEDGRT